MDAETQRLHSELAMLRCLAMTQDKNNKDLEKRMFKLEAQNKALKDQLAAHPNTEPPSPPPCPASPAEDLLALQNRIIQLETQLNEATEALHQKNSTPSKPAPPGLKSPDTPLSQPANVWSRVVQQKYPTFKSTTSTPAVREHARDFIVRRGIQEVIVSGRKFLYIPENLHAAFLRHMGDVLEDETGFKNESAGVGAGTGKRKRALESDDDDGGEEEEEEDQEWDDEGEEDLELDDDDEEEDDVGQGDDESSVEMPASISSRPTLPPPTPGDPAPSWIDLVRKHVDPTFKCDEKDARCTWIRKFVYEWRDVKNLPTRSTKAFVVPRELQDAFLEYVRGVVGEANDIGMPVSIPPWRKRRSIDRELFGRGQEVERKEGLEKVFADSGDSPMPGSGVSAVTPRVWGRVTIDRNFGQGPEVERKEGLGKVFGDSGDSPMLGSAEPSWMDLVRDNIDPDFKCDQADLRYVRLRKAAYKFRAKYDLTKRNGLQSFLVPAKLQPELLEIMWAVVRKYDEENGGGSSSLGGLERNVVSSDHENVGHGDEWEEEDEVLEEGNVASIPSPHHPLQANPSSAESSWHDLVRTHLDPKFKNDQNDTRCNFVRRFAYEFQRKHDLAKRTRRAFVVPANLQDDFLETMRGVLLKWDQRRVISSSSQLEPTPGAKISKSESGTDLLPAMSVIMEIMPKWHIMEPDDQAHVESKVREFMEEQMEDGFTECFLPDGSVGVPLGFLDDFRTWWAENLPKAFPDMFVAGFRTGAVFIVACKERLADPIEASDNKLVALYTTGLEAAHTALAEMLPQSELPSLIASAPASTTTPPVPPEPLLAQNRISSLEAQPTPAADALDQRSTNLQMLHHGSSSTPPQALTPSVSANKSNLWSKVLMLRFPAFKTHEFTPKVRQHAARFAETHGLEDVIRSGRKYIYIPPELHLAYLDHMEEFLLAPVEIAVAPAPVPVPAPAPPVVANRGIKHDRDAGHSSKRDDVTNGCGLDESGGGSQKRARVVTPPPKSKMNASLTNPKKGSSSKKVVRDVEVDQAGRVGVSWIGLVRSHIAPTFKANPFDRRYQNIKKAAFRFRDSHGLNDMKSKKGAFLIPPQFQDQFVECMREAIDEWGGDMEAAVERMAKGRVGSDGTAVKVEDSEDFNTRAKLQDEPEFLSAHRWVNFAPFRLFVVLIHCSSVIESTMPDFKQLCDDDRNSVDVAVNCWLEDRLGDKFETCFLPDGPLGIPRALVEEFREWVLKEVHSMFVDECE
ncbi:hypothetical protein HDU98_008608 [Podochytrium sp. JEL0797]|nr:hypothetical protein HDU98_008608 [Podochytrium sp. JEL0797]